MSTDFPLTAHYSDTLTVQETKFQGQIGVSNEDRKAVRKIKLDDLKATLERQMTDKYITLENNKLESLDLGDRIVQADQ